MQLTREQYIRYSRHITLPQIGLEGQKKLLQAKVLIIGAGGLGSPLGFYLAAAGVGTLGLVDFDQVDLSNLQRQILHTNDDIGKSKVESAEKRIHAMNPDTRVIKHPVKMSSENAFEIIKDYDVVIDGTDNFPTRYLVNDACFFLNKVNIYGSIFRFEGQVTVFPARGGSLPDSWQAGAFGGKPKEGPCYRCLYPEPPPPGMVPSCAEGGVLGILPGVIGLIQATEAIKWITRQGELLVGRLLIYDALKMSFRELKLKRDPECPLCGQEPSVQGLIDYEEFCGLRRGEPGADPDLEITAVDLKIRLDGKEDILILDVREPEEYAIAHIEGSVLIPVGELPARLSELEEYKAKEIICHCHHGSRSLRAAGILKQAGFKKVKNLQGGIEEWSLQVDPSIVRY